MVPPRLGPEIWAGMFARDVLAAYGADVAAA